MIGAKDGEQLVDATINIVDINSKKTVSSGRTYTSATSNPKAYIVSPGSYIVKVKALGTYKGQLDEIDVTIKAGEKKKVIGSFKQ